ncbi:hypothetical protein RIF29_11478 [Crotalaria pallida]|uniref:Secreted protein n=1 Tax=Crotalaria pallida TaxID=3830 RepID=A0AAN9IM67_CROPI
MYNQILLLLIFLVKMLTNSFPQCSATNLIVLNIRNKYNRSVDAYIAPRRYKINFFWGIFGSVSPKPIALSQSSPIR